jgi:hypothetical protein
MKENKIQKGYTVSPNWPFGDSPKRPAGKPENRKE